MKLQEYLEFKKIKQAAFAKLVGVSAQNITRYARGQRIPDDQIMPLIFLATDGAVSPNDFYNLPPKPKKKPKRK